MTTVPRAPGVRLTLDRALDGSRLRPGTVRRVGRYEIAMAAERAGTDVEELRHLVALGILHQEIVDAATGSEVVLREIGPVELKGVDGPMRLHAASRAG
jgi:hypothetical protein